MWDPNITNKEPGNYYRGFVVCPVCHTGRVLIVSEFALKENKNKTIWHTCRHTGCNRIFETSIGEIVENANRKIMKKTTKVFLFGFIFGIALEALIFLGVIIYVGIRDGRGGW